MDKAPSSLMNLDYGLFSKACDHERTAKIGWLLYSTHQQDKERISEMISKLVQESVRAKWHHTRTNDRFRKEPAANQERIYALHLEGAEECAARIRE
jgi:hypothetical protein